MKYKHTQIGYLMIVILFFVTILFGSIYIIGTMEPVSVDSGNNFLFTFVMLLIIFILSSFVTLQVMVDEKYLRIKFGYGIFRNKFLLKDIIEVREVKNSWFYGWGIKWWPNFWIYSISGFDAVEIVLKNGRKYRIGTDEPKKLKKALL